jgi:hypothetical protein
MPIFGLDISHHQGTFDVSRAAREGCEFFIFKATEGSGFTDSRFAENVRKARAAGKVFAAYHYQRSTVSAAAQVAHIQRVVSKDIPVIPDVEANSGGVELTRDIVNRLRSTGYAVPLLYLPRWYWQQIGSPSLEGLPPLWSSRYPDMRQGSLSDEYADVPSHYWNGYGGRPVAVLQFTSSARVAGRSPIDGNAFRGSAADLRGLFGRIGGGGAAPGQEDDMSAEAEKKITATHAGLFYGSTVGGKEWPSVLAILAETQRRVTVNTNLMARQNGISADAVAEALTPRLATLLLPPLEAAFVRVAGTDNAEQARAVVAELARVLATDEDQQEGSTA